MTTEEVEFVRRTGRRPFRLKEIFNSYFFVAFPLAVFLAGTFLFSNTFGHGDKEARASTIFFIIGLISLVWTIKRLYDNQRFKRIRTSNTASDNIVKIKQVIEELEWELYLDNKERVIAFSGTTWFSWGEQISVVIDDKDILINSRPTRQPITNFQRRIELNEICSRI